MTTPRLSLHHFPGACSRVAVCALNMAALDFDLVLVDLANGHQSRPDYLAKSALGKVPMLLVDGEPLLENAAILMLIHGLRPDAGLIPGFEMPRSLAEAIGGIAFCGGTLHPIVRGLANPLRLTTGDDEPVRERSRELAKKSFGYAERRLSENGWWLGERSIVDVYLDWAFGVARNAGFDTDAFPLLNALPGRLGDMPAYRAMLETESRARTDLGL